MPFSLGTTAVSDLLNIWQVLPRHSFLTSNGEIFVMWRSDDSQTLKYVTSNDGITFSSPITLLNDSDYDRFTGHKDSDNNIYILFRETNSPNPTDRRLRLLKMTYTGNATWIKGSVKQVNNSNPNITTMDLYKDSNGRIWVLFQEYNYVTSTWLDVKVVYSDDDGDNWSAETTLLVTMRNGWDGYRPRLVLRNGKPVAYYGRFVDGVGAYIAVREWNGSSWDAEVKTACSGYPDWCSSVEIGGNVYYTVGDLSGPRKIILYKWNGISLTNEKTLTAKEGTNPSVSTDGTKLFLLYTNWLNNQTKEVFFMEYNLSTGIVTRDLTIDAVTTGNYIRNCTLPNLIVGENIPVFYGKQIDSIKYVYCALLNFNYGVKISWPGYNVKTATPDQLSLSSKFGSLHMIEKGKTTMNVNTWNPVTSRYTGSKTIPISNTGVYPLSLVWVEDKNGWLRHNNFKLFEDPDDGGYYLSSKVENNQLLINMNSDTSLTNLEVIYFVFDKGILDSSYTPSYNYGLKVSQPGHDVKTAPLKYLTMHSSFMLPQITSQGEITLHIPVGTGAWGQVAHGLGYAPAFLPYIKIPLNNKWYSNVVYPQAIYGFKIITYCNSTYFKFRAIRDYSTQETDIYFKYIFFKDLST